MANDFATEGAQSIARSSRGMTTIEELLARFPADRCHVRFMFEYGPGGYLVQALLTFSSGEIRAGTVEPVPDRDAAIAEVVNALSKFLDHDEKQVLLAELSRPTAVCWP